MEHETDPAESEQPEPESREPESDGDVETGADVAALVAPGERVYRIFQLRIGADGSIGGRQREVLPQPVYGRSVALKYLSYYAKQLAPQELLVLVDGTNRIVNVAQGESGRLRPALKTEVRRILAQSFNVVRERRTSRPASGQAKPRRTSRPAAKRRW